MPSDVSQLVPALGNAMLLYHPGTAEHSARVGATANAIASVLELPEADISTVHWAGLLHDIGKLAVPEEILSKPGPLTRDEWFEVQRHPAVGFDILVALSEGLEPVAQAVRSHHERWDGRGYPDGLAGTAIPLAGRIVAVADVFDALTHRRSYRPRIYTRMAALEHLVGNRGRLFDGDVVDALLRALSVRN